MYRQNGLPHGKTACFGFLSKKRFLTIAILFHSFNLLAFSATPKAPLLEKALKSSFAGRHIPQTSFVPKNTTKYIERSIGSLDHLRDPASGQSLTPAEHLSILHQKDLLGVFQRTNMPDGFHFEGYLLGIIDSDFGKLSLYKHLLTDSSDASDLLLGVISGKLKDMKSTKALVEVLDEKTLINPELTTDQMRDTFNKITALVSYFHDFPGIIDSILAYELNEIDKETFQKAITTNLFHNGPSIGFWGKLTKTILPINITKAQAQKRVAHFMKGTIFSFEEETLHINYPHSLSLEGTVHRIFDRISQGTRGGLLKIYAELHTTMTPAQKISEFVETTFPGTVLQLQTIKAGLEAHAPTPSANHTRLTKWIDAGVEYIETMKTKFERTVATHEPLKLIVASGNDQMTEHLLREIFEAHEATHGDPMRVFD